MEIARHPGGGPVLVVLPGGVTHQRDREDAARSQRAMTRSIWTMLVTGAIVFYYLVERVAQAMSLY